MILFLHGAGMAAGQITPARYPLLGRLERLVPEGMLAAPVLNDGWMEATARALEALGPEDAVVGHSHGGAMALKCIAERMPGLRLAAFLGCAMPLWGAPDWEEEEFVLPGNTAEALGGVGRITLVQAEDDEVVDPGHLDLYADRLPDARRVRLPKGGHDLDTPRMDAVLADAAGALADHDLVGADQPQHVARLLIEQVEVQVGVRHPVRLVLQHRHLGLQLRALCLELPCLGFDLDPAEQAVVALHGGEGEVEPERKGEGEIDHHAKCRSSAGHCHLVTASSVGPLRGPVG